MSGNIKYKDSVFTLLFGEKDKLIELYNAISGTNYTADVAFEITTLQEVLFFNRINDISFLIDNKFVVLIEHQSTINENMPLRCLLYAARVYEKIMENDNIYRDKLINIATPEFIVCYNGEKPQPDNRILKLSDAFIDKSKQNLELTVKVLNVNKGHNLNVVKKSRTLEEYALFIDKVNEYKKKYSNLNEALKNALRYCIENNILKEFLLLHGSEVINMLNVEWNLDDAKRIWKEEAMEEGFEEGIKDGIKKGIKEGMKEGVKEGMKKGEIKKAVETAKKMILRNKLIDEIIEFTGLTEKEILKIKNEGTL